jgi:hypothetical protein
MGNEINPDTPAAGNGTAEAERPEPGLTEAVVGFLDRQARGEPIEIDRYCQLHPHLMPALRAELESTSELDLLLDPPQPAFQTAAPAEPLPEWLSGHKILGIIGQGGMGRVILAEDERLGRRVAIKTLNLRYRDNLELRARFMQEARALASLNHPHIVNIFNLGEPAEIPHFVMEYVEGKPLALAAQPLPLEQKSRLDAQGGFSHRLSASTPDDSPGFKAGQHSGRERFGA